MKKEKPNRHDFEDRINAHAWKSPAFKKKMLTDPKAALSELGGHLSSEVSIKVVEERKNECVIVLHPLPSQCTNISEEELRKISGGDGFMCTNPAGADFGPGQYTCAPGGGIM